MKNLIWAIFFSGAGISASANDGSFTLSESPWSDRNFEVCPKSDNTSLRVVVFEPEIETWTYTIDGADTVRLKATENGIIERIVKTERSSPAFFLKEQKIGYVDDNDNWVDENGVQIARFEQLKIVRGIRTKPNIKGLTIEETVYASDLEKEQAAAMEKIHYEAPCSVFLLEHYDIREADFKYDFGDNNPYECHATEGMKRSESLDYIAKLSRSVVSRPDGSQYYVKFPNGEIKVFGWAGVEHLYNNDGSLICDWNDLGQFAGYELIQQPE